MPLDTPFERFRPDPFLFDAAGSKWAVPPAMWTPASLSAVKAWCSADDHGTANMTDDGGGLISSWKDRIGGLALTAATTARPTWGATAFNGAKAGLTFDGSANVLAANAVANLPTGSTSGTLWAVAQPSLVASRFIAAYGSNTAYRRIGLNVSNINARSSTTDTVSGTTTIGTNQLMLLEGVFDANLEARLDGVLEGTATETLSTGTTVARIGSSASSSPANFWQGPIRQVLVTTVLSTIQRQQIEGWLAWDSGLERLLPANHPYVSGPP